LSSSTRQADYRSGSSPSRPCVCRKQRTRELPAPIQMSDALSRISPKVEVSSPCRRTAWRMEGGGLWRWRITSRKNAVMCWRRLSSRRTGPRAGHVAGTMSGRFPCPAKMCEGSELFSRSRYTQPIAIGLHWNDLTSRFKASLGDIVKSVSVLRQDL